MGKSQIACHQSTARWSVESAEQSRRLAARVEPGRADEGGGCLPGLGGGGDVKGSADFTPTHRQEVGGKGSR